MGFLDFGRAVRVEHEAQEASHLVITKATTNMHVQADAAEARGEHQTAKNIRLAAGSMQSAANRRHRPRSN